MATENPDRGALLPFDTIWEDAYAQFEREKPKLVEFYRDSILAEARSKCQDARRDNLDKDVDASSAEELQKQFLAVLDIQHEYIQERQWRIKFKDKSVQVGEIVEKTVYTITKAKDFIASVASKEPHAAIAWAAVSCLLPLILNASSQDEEAVLGLDYIRDLLERYALMQRILTRRAMIMETSEQSERVQSKLRSKMVDLYAQTLDFQFTLMKQFSRRKMSRFIRDVGRELAGSDNWKAMLGNIKEADGIVNDQMKSLESEVQNEIHSAVQAQCNQLAQINKSLEESRTESKQRTLNEWLARMIPGDTDTIHDKLRDQICHADSGKWFVEQTKSWLEADDGKMIIWRHGIPGMGKSLLMSSAITEIGRCCGELGYDGLAFIYFQWDKKIEQTKRAVSASILRQLCPFSKKLVATLETLKDNAHTSPSPDELTVILTDYGQSPELAPTELVKQAAPNTYAKFLIFIDAFDEASTETRSYISKWIDTLDPNYFRILITSRNDANVITDDGKTEVFEIKANDDDLKAYIKARLELPPTSSIFRGDDEFMGKIAQVISSHANNMFLYAKHHTLLVGKEVSRSEMMKAAEKPFGSLVEIYDDLLKDLKLDDTAVATATTKALAWLTFAKSRLNRETFLEAMALSPGDRTFYGDRRPALDAIIALCRGLIEWDEKTDSIRLSHQTAQEYLRSRRSIIQFRETIVATCFTCLALKNAINADSLADDDESYQVDDDKVDEKKNNHADRFGSDDTIKDQDCEKMVIGRTGTIHFVEDADDNGELELPNLLSGNEPQDPDMGLVNIKEEMQSGAYCHDFGPDALDKWSMQTGHMASYCGSFAISHLADIASASEAPSDLVITSIRRFLETQPNQRLWRRCKRGRNQYRWKCTPLHIAAWLRNGPLLEAVFPNPSLDINIDINIADIGGETPLMYAAKSGNEEVVRKLLDLGANPSVRNIVGKTAIELLTFDVAEDVARSLLSPEKALPRNVLIRPSRLGFYRVVKVLLDLEDSKVDVNATSPHEKRTALGYACAMGYVKIATLLLDRGADADAADGRRKTPLHQAARSASIDRPGGIECVALLLDRGAKPNVVDWRGCSPLLEAITDVPRARGPNIVKLVDVFTRRRRHINNIQGEGAVDLDACGHSCGTPLYECRRKFPRAATRLLKAGADLHCEVWGWTVYQHVAVEEPDPRSPIFRAFYDAERAWARERGVPVTACPANSAGDTALHLVASGALGARGVQLMFKLPGGRDVLERRNAIGQTPIFLAIHLHGASIIRHLLDAGAHADLVDFRGNSVLDIALSVAHPGIIGMLLERPGVGVSAPWDADGIEIRRFEGETWYSKLRELIISHYKSPGSHLYMRDHDFHVSSELPDGPIIMVDSQRVIDQQICPVRLPSDPGMRVRRVAFKFRSRDQGHSWKQKQLGGTYLVTWSWFVAGLVRQENLDHLRTPGRGRLKHSRHIQHNMHASAEYRTYHVVWDRDRDLDGGDLSATEWMDLFRPGDGLIVRAACVSTGWENHVESFRVEVWGDFRGGGGETGEGEGDGGNGGSGAAQIAEE